MSLSLKCIDQKLEREALKSLTREFGYDIDCPVTAHEKSKITEYIVNAVMQDIKANYAHVAKDYSSEIRSKLEKIDPFIVVERGNNSYDLDFSDFSLPSLSDIVNATKSIFSGIYNFTFNYSQ